MSVDRRQSGRQVTLLGGRHVSDAGQIGGGGAPIGGGGPGGSSVPSCSRLAAATANSVPYTLFCGVRVGLGAALRAALVSVEEARKVACRQRP